jgi:glycosyltransferase involved in cell wall biosynthesis/O-antigen/teichoic acid export membrane protein
MSRFSAGIERWPGRPLRAGILHHIFGIGGQIAAAAPIIVVTIILSHTAGLVPAGQFVIAAGASAIIFTTAFLGLVYYVSVDRLREFDTRDFVQTRVTATLIAVALLFAVSGHLDVPLLLVLLVGLLRVADAAVDLAWGLDLLRLPTGQAMQRYAVLNAAKLLIVVLAVAPAVLYPSAAIPLLIGGASVSAVGCWIWLVMLAKQGAPAQAAGNRLRRSMRLARRTIWFTLGAGIAAAASSTPRLIIARYYSGDALGIAGVTLAFSTLFAMAFMSSWLRWFPRLSQTPEHERRFSGMILESFAMLLFFLLLNLTVTPWVVSLLFGFNAHAENDLSRQILIASTFFGFAINMANFFKVTRAVWLESMCYVAGVVTGLGYIATFNSAGVPGFLIAGSIAMLATVVIGTAWVRRRVPPPAEAEKNNRAIFLRLAARPVPRVTRMMTVARDSGLDAIFVGAFRDKELPKDDSWEAFPVRRVGNPFPLLNGKRPLLYVRSVLSCNLGFLSLLWKERPRVVHASDLEVMPAAILYRIAHPSRLIFNIHDNLAQRYSLPGWINAFLNAIEGAAVLLSDQTLVPEEFRRKALPGWCWHKVRVIRNLPPDKGAKPPPPFTNGKIRLFYGGWLDWQRGLEALLALAQEPDIELRIAGEGAPVIVDRLKQLSSVTYLGFLDSQAILDETIACHFVAALYDPSRVINRFAASNKLAEALSIGRPAILNTELEIAKELAGACCIVETPYAQAAGIAPTLRALAADTGAYARACSSARQLYDENYSWEKVKTDSVIAMTGADGIQGSLR